MATQEDRSDVQKKHRCVGVRYGVALRSGLVSYLLSHIGRDGHGVEKSAGMNGSDVEASRIGVSM